MIYNGTITFAELILIELFKFEVFLIPKTRFTLRLRGQLISNSGSGTV